MYFTTVKSYYISLAWPDRYFFYRAFIACSISARRKKRVWSRSITRVVLDTSEPTGGVNFSDLYNKVSIRNSFVP